MSDRAVKNLIVMERKRKKDKQLFFEAPQRHKYVNEKREL